MKFCNVLIMEKAKKTKMRVEAKKRKNIRRPYSQGTKLCRFKEISCGQH